MTHRTPNNIHQSRPQKTLRPQTLRVDSLRAWRQSNDAVILPIVYELVETGGGFNSDSAIVPINWPLRRFATSIIPLEIPGQKTDRKQKLALLKKKLESARERAAKRAAIQAAKQANIASTKPAEPENQPTTSIRHLPTAVPLLLLCVIALVVFAWICFR
ncbi:MAG: hypothetical protein ACRD82_21765 [Blastocatellia bacterium]